jgi:hypothetical protein
LYDNARSHFALVVKTKHGHTLYSPDLATAAFLPLAAVKTALNGKKFRDVQDNKKSVTAKLNAAPLEPNDVFKTS